MSNKDFDVILIEPNSLALTKDNLYTNIYEITRYVRFLKTNNEELMYDLYDLLQLTPEIVGDSDIIYENDTHIYQLFHNSDNLHRTDEEGKFLKPKDTIPFPENRIATLLVNSEKKINGPAILICSKIQSNYLCSTSSITSHELMMLLNKIFVHQGVIVNVDTSIDQFTYVTPLDNIPEDVKQNYNYIETTIYNFHLIGCYDASITDQENKLATLLFNTKIYGSVRICLVTNTKFIDIEPKLINNLIYCCINKTERKYYGNEDLPEKSAGVTIIKNNHTLLKRKIEVESINCCAPNCKEECDIDNNNIFIYNFRCQGCYNAYYHSKHCMDDNIEEHKKSCIQ